MGVVTPVVGWRPTTGGCEACGLKTVCLVKTQNSMVKVVFVFNSGNISNAGFKALGAILDGGFCTLLYPGFWIFLLPLINEKK